MDSGGDRRNFASRLTLAQWRKPHRRDMATDSLLGAQLTSAYQPSTGDGSWGRVALHRYHADRRQPLQNGPSARTRLGSAHAKRLRPRCAAAHAQALERRSCTPRGPCWVTLFSAQAARVTKLRVVAKRLHCGCQGVARNFCRVHGRFSPNDLDAIAGGEAPPVGNAADSDAHC